MRLGNRNPDEDESGNDEFDTRLAESCLGDSNTAGLDTLKEGGVFFDDTEMVCVWGPGVVDNFRGVSHSFDECFLALESMWLLVAGEIAVGGDLGLEWEVVVLLPDGEGRGHGAKALRCEPTKKGSAVASSSCVLGGKLFCQVTQQSLG